MSGDKEEPLKEINGGLAQDCNNNKTNDRENIDRKRMERLYKL
jgi:hypothetical protein